MSTPAGTAPNADGLPDPRRHYWRYQHLQRWLAGIARDHPDLIVVERYGSSAEGRPLYVVKVGTDAGRARPALWVDANMHSSELIGVNVAVCFVDDLIALHRGDNRHGLSARAAAAAKASLVYVVPTVSPDGMEAVQEDGRFVRSSPVLAPGRTTRPRWRQVDIDGDGQVRRMRVADPCGGFVESAHIAGLMLPRTIDDDGPFYALYPEGVIDDWDGLSVPPWGIFDDNPLDLNRNFTTGWKAEPEQEGAGDFAGSAPEARALMALVTSSPHIYAWVNLHTFGGVWIRPLGNGPDTRIGFADRAIFRLVEDWATTHAGVPTVSGFAEFTYVPEKPLCGDLVDYVWHQRGAYAWAVELWDIFSRAGLPRGRRFVDRYTDQTPADLEHLARALGAVGAAPIEPWRPVTHPQLGEVEVGGFDPRFSVWNPPEGPLVDEIARGHAAVFLRLLSLLPALQVSTRRTAIADGVFVVEITVENRGGLPTHGPAAATALPHNEPVGVVVDDASAPRVKDGPRRTLGHLGGTQAGRFGPGSTWPYQNTEGLPARRRCSFVVTGSDPVRFTVGSVRTGFIDVEG
jgi:hypothetical protein